MIGVAIKLNKYINSEYKHLSKRKKSVCVCTQVCFPDSARNADPDLWAR